MTPCSFNPFDIPLMNFYKKISLFFWHWMGINNFYLSAICIGINVSISILLQSISRDGLMLFTLLVLLYKAQKEDENLLAQAFKEGFFDFCRILCLVSFVSEYDDKGMFLQLLFRVFLVSSVYLMSLPTLPLSEKRFLKWLKSTFYFKRMVFVPVKVKK